MDSETKNGELSVSVEEVQQRTDCCDDQRAHYKKNETRSQEDKFRDVHFNIPFNPNKIRSA
jgi:hypothetical protein